MSGICEGPYLQDLTEDNQGTIVMKRVKNHNPDTGVIDTDRYPGLTLLCWNRNDSAEAMTRYEAFCLYESQWRHLGFDQLEKNEQEFIQSLIDEFGHGVLNA